MKAAKGKHEWENLLKAFSEENEGRPTRLGVFETNSRSVNDLWLECGLPLVGVDIDTHGDTPVVQVMVGSLTHKVNKAVKVSRHLTTNGEDDGLDVLDSDGLLTVLRFEK